MLALGMSNCGTWPGTMICIRICIMSSNTVAQRDKVAPPHPDNPGLLVWRVEKVNRTFGSQKWNHPDEWFVFDISSNQYGGPYSGQEMKNRALSQIQTPFWRLRCSSKQLPAFCTLGQDTASRRCSLMMKARELCLGMWAGMGAFATAGILGSGGLAMVVWGLCAVNILTATTGGISGRRLSFRNWGRPMTRQTVQLWVSSISKAAGRQQHELCAGFKQYLCRLKPPVVQPLPVPLIHMFEETRSPEPWFFDGFWWHRFDPESWAFKKRRAIGKGNKFVWGWTSWQTLKHL